MTPMSNEVHDVLVKARAKVAQGWTRGELARDVGGNRCSPVAAKAASFCAEGAICNAAVGLPDGIGMQAIRRVANAAHLAFASGITRWNDDDRRTQSEVLAAFDKAIASTTQNKE